MVSEHVRPDMRQNAIREGTRRDIVDMLVLRDTPFHGRLDCLDFLNRVWPLDEMPSQDFRFQTATADIATHLRFGDWDDALLLLERLSLARDSDERFMRFIEMVVHPLVVTDEGAAFSQVQAVNRWSGSPASPRSGSGP